MKTGRNKPCWCGSNKKYKECHLDRDKQLPLTRGELEAHGKQQSARKKCSVANLFPNQCSKDIIKAHTISKSGSLKEIAENGHVFGTKPSLDSLIKTDGKLTLTKVGIGQASTFSGFCSVHDKKIFSPLEDEKITLTNEQLFLLSYRGMCREIYCKESQIGGVEFMKEADRGTDAMIQMIIQSFSSSFGYGVDLAIRDLTILKEKMDEIFISSSFQNVNHCIIKLSAVPKVLVSSMIAPEMDFHGNRIQELGDKEHIYHYIFFNCISFDGRGCFVFSWLDEHSEYCVKFINSLMSFNYQGVSNAVIRFCYSFAENVWASPSWWESLGLLERSSIEERLHHGTPLMSHPIDCLVDDNIIFSALDIESIELRGNAFTSAS